MNINKLIKIQLYILKKNIYNNLVKNKELFILLNKFSTKKEEKDFIEMQHIISNSFYKKNIKKLLNSIYRYYNIFPKISVEHFLSAWIIAFYPHFVLSRLDNIFILSHTLLQNIFNLHNLLFIFHKYSNCILIFLENDKLDQTQKLLIEYNDITQVLLSNTNPECIFYINQIKNNILKQLHFFTSS